MRDDERGRLAYRTMAAGDFAAGRAETLRIALYAEYEARAFYCCVAEAFAGKHPFVVLLGASRKRVGWLEDACRQRGVARPQDTQALTTKIAVAWLDNCLRAVRGELQLVGLYQTLQQHAEAQVLFDLYGKLQRHSSQQQLPLIEHAIETAVEGERFHAAHGVTPDHAYLRHGLLSTVLEKAFSILGAEHRAFGVFAPVLPPVLHHAPPALLAGLAFGGATAACVVKLKSSSKRKVG